MQLPILGSLVQIDKTLVPQILDDVLGYEGSGNVALAFDKRDETFNGYELSFFYKTETSGARPLEFDIESNTVILPPQLFTDKGKIYIGLLGTKQVGDKLVKITTSPARLRVRETVDPNDLDGMPSESEWIEVINQMVNQLSKDLDTRITKLEQEGTGGGTKDHSKLINRDAENSHPLSAITGLVSALAEKLEKSKLGEAITQALAQAKASGQFDGKDGQDGQDGISPTMNVTQSQEGTTFTVTDMNGQKSATIKNGTDGQDGKTPQKGVDYFTVQDKQEIENATADKLKPSIPTKNSQLENDAGYQTDRVVELVKLNELNYNSLLAKKEKGIALYVINADRSKFNQTPIPLTGCDGLKITFSIPFSKETGQGIVVTCDSKNLTQVRYDDGQAIPTKTSQLQNDSGFLTQHQNISHLATKQEIPSKLPTPNALTFTGAISGTFDGSSPLTVNVPQGGGSGGNEPWVELYKGTITIPSPITVLEQELNDKNEYKEYDILIKFSQSTLQTDANPCVFNLSVNKLSVGYYAPNIGASNGLKNKECSLKWEICNNSKIPYFNFAYTPFEFQYQQLTMKKQHYVYTRNQNKGKGLSLSFNAEYQGTVDIQVYGRGVDNE